MIDIKNTVDFYWDAVCPWCWITSRWMQEVAQQKSIHVNWKLFSLRKINEGREVPAEYAPIHVMGLRALRVAAAVREAHGNDALGHFYTAIGARRHHDDEDIGDIRILEMALEEVELPTTLALAASDEKWDQVIKADMAEATAKAGAEVGVPLIVLEGGQGPGFFGPVFSPAPTGQAAIEFWDAMVITGSTPGFFEFKRTRETGPIFSARPVITGGSSTS